MVFASSSATISVPGFALTSSGTATTIGFRYKVSYPSSGITTTMGEYEYCDNGTATTSWAYSANTASLMTNIIGFADITTTSDGWTTYTPCIYPQNFIPSPKERLAEMLRTRSAPAAITSRHRTMPQKIDIREQRARETLRRVIGEDKFKNFLKTGFVTVKGKSGLTYQIFPGHGITKVYNKGVMTERLCVVLQGNFPETDSIIMRFLMILNNENQFREKAVKHSVFQSERPAQKAVVPMRSLQEVYNELKGVA